MPKGGLLVLSFWHWVGALGETMAVAFLIGSVMSIPGSITDPTTSIPVLLANNFAEAQDLEMSSMYYLALILFVVSFFIISIAKFYFLGKSAKVK